MTNTELIVLTHTVRAHIKNGELEKVIGIVLKEARDRCEEDEIPYPAEKMIEIIERMAKSD